MFWPRALASAQGSTRRPRVACERETCCAGAPAGATLGRQSFQPWVERRGSWARPRTGEQNRRGETESSTSYVAVGFPVFRRSESKFLFPVTVSPPGAVSDGSGEVFDGSIDKTITAIGNTDRSCPRGASPAPLPFSVPLRPLCWARLGRERRRVGRRRVDLEPCPALPEATGQPRPRFSLQGPPLPPPPHLSPLTASVISGLLLRIPFWLFLGGGRELARQLRLHSAQVVFARF